MPRRAVGEEVVLALGSNLGDRIAHLRMGVGLLGEAVDVTRVSSVVESAPEGTASRIPQPDFLNVVFRGRTSLDPFALLDACLRVEDAAGRERGEPGSPRTLDVDLLFYGGRVVKQERLRIPHPRWKERGFVLLPLLEIAPEWRDPEGGETVKTICESRSDALERARVVASPGALEVDR